MCVCLCREAAFIGLSLNTSTLDWEWQDGAPLTWSFWPAGTVAVPSDVAAPFIIFSGRFVVSADRIMSYLCEMDAAGSHR